MNAKEMWNLYTKDDSMKYDAWAFGDDADLLASLVKQGIKTATCSLHVFYELENEELPQVGEYSVILDSKEEAVCIIQTTKVAIVPFNEISEEHAYKEGERKRTLNDWKEIHIAFFTNELEVIGKKFNENMLLVCEEFKVVYK